MMLKLKRTKFKLFGIIACCLLLSLGYIGLSYYNVPKKANAMVTWFPEASGPVPSTATIKDINYLQEMNSKVCENSADITDEVTLKDVRDGQNYTIKVLADGKCWMTQNLRLAGGTSINRIDSNLSAAVYTTDTQTYILPDATAGAFSNATAKDQDEKATYMNHQVRDSSDPDYGAYYSWCVATAGTCQIGTYANIQPTKDTVPSTTAPASTVAVPANQQASSSICPKGWRLPIGGASGELKALFTTYPNNTTPSVFQTDGNKNGFWLGASSAGAGGIFFSAAGHVINSGFKGADASGHYWTGTAISLTSAYSMDFTSTSIAVPASNARYVGYSVRCIANENISTSNFIPNNNSGHTESVTGMVSIQVANTISIDAVADDNIQNILVDSTEVATGTFSATVISNTNYRVLLSAAETALMPKTSTNEASVPASSNVVAGTNAWGIQNADGTYMAITTSEREYHHTHPENDTDGRIHEFTIGISVSPTLPADIYSTDITITAASV